MISGGMILAIETDYKKIVERYIEKTNESPKWKTM